MTSTSKQAVRAIEHYVHGGGTVIVVPARVAAWLERRAGLNQLRINNRGIDSEVDAVLGALRIASLTWRSSVTGTTDATPPELPASSHQWLSTTKAAIHLGITDRAVRKAISTGALQAEKTAGRWRIHRDDIAHYQATRHTGGRHAAI